MALKFRRGTTAQQSGSLAFGEPYVNTTLGTLLIGGPDGDIVLGTSGTGSTGNFGAISGSGLDIIGDANIHGNLVLGGNITIGDANTDTFTLNADLSSSIIPDIDNVFDIGTPTKKYANIYGNTISGSTIEINSGSNPELRFVNRTTGIGYHIQNGDGGNFQIHNSTTDKLLFKFQSASLAEGNQDGYFYSNLIVSESVSSYTIASNHIIASTITGSVSGSITGIGNVTNYSSSVNSRLVNLETTSGSVNEQLTQMGVVTASLIPSASAAKITNDAQDVSITNLNILTASALTRFTALEIETANLELTTASLNVSVSNLNTYTGSLNNAIQLTGSTVSFLGNIVVYGTQSVINSQNVSISDNIIYLSPTASIDNDLGIVGHYNDGTYRHAGIFMDASDGHSWKVFNGLTTETSAQIDTAGNGFTLADFKAGAFTGTSFAGQILATNGVVSGSSQIPSILPTGTVSGSSQVIGILSSLNTYTGSNDTTNTTQNSRLDLLSTASGSAITRLTALEVDTTNLEAFTSSINTTIKSKLDADGVISSSAQLTTTFDSRYLNTNGDGIVSGSSQILHDSTTGYSANKHIDHTAVSISAGSGLTGGGDISATRTLSIATGGVTNGMLANSTISGISLGSNLATLTIGTGLSGTSYNCSGAVTIALPQAVATSSNVQFNSLGIGMAASATAGRIDATNDIVAYSSSDIRFKENIKVIENPIDKIRKISGNTYDWKEENKIEHGYEGNDVGVIAQEIEAVLPQLVQTRDNGYKAVKYDKLVALLIEGIKEQQLQIEDLKIELKDLKKQKGL